LDSHYLDWIGQQPSRWGAVREEDIQPAVREGPLLLEQEHRYSCNREEEEAEAHCIRNNDNSNHNTAACNGFGARDCTHARDVEAGEEAGALVVVVLVRAGE
jgi:hypothetical protein